ncbi:MAG: hypothetical protein KAV00_12025, partial [Phycisphaerae bacterium]|nr:hypothetical protein [Phycisphaerae bacterium]
MPNNTINFGPILCSACSLHDQAAHPGLPTRPLWQRPATPSWTNLAPIPVGSSKQALVVVGMAPGRDEDELGMSWVGWSGRFLYRILTESLELHKHADIYLSNACRCYNPPGEKIRKGQLSACRPHLLRDLQTIVQRYGPANVVVLALGSEAVSTLVGTSIKAAVAYQGVPRTLLDSTELPPLPVFVSYHPAMFLPGRDPARVEPFNVHLQLLKDYFTKPRKILSFPKPLINAAPQQIRCPRVVSLDIETYGLLRGKEQTVFHPAKSESVDGIPRSRQVLCVSLAWRTLDGIKAAFYDLTNEKHRRNFTLVLQFIIRRNFTLVG